MPPHDGASRSRISWASAAKKGARRLRPSGQGARTNVLLGLLAQGRGSCDRERSAQCGQGDRFAERGEMGMKGE